MSEYDNKLPGKSNAGQLASFLDQVAKTPMVKAARERGRLIFAMDATASREPTWDRACHIQSQMFERTAALGGLDIQLCYYRGHGEFSASPWLSDSKRLQERMTGVFCLGGITQMERLLCHALAETARQKVSALVFVGDCVEESADRLFQLAGEAGMRGLPLFLFQEGNEPTTEMVFRKIAHLSHGAYCTFDGSSARQLADLLSAVAVYAAGGRRALADYSALKGPSVAGMLQQLTKE